MRDVGPAVGLVTALFVKEILMSQLRFFGEVITLFAKKDLFRQAL